MKRTAIALIAPSLLALGACGDSPAQSLAKAKAEYAAHDYGAARIHLANALTANPGDRTALLLQARTLLALGDGEGAGAAIDNLSGSRPPSGEFAELAGEAALLRNSPDKAVELLGDLKSAEAERLRALAAIEKNDLPAAQTHFERGLALGGNARLFANYARYLLMSGDIEGASRMEDRAIKAEPDGIDTLLFAGQLAVRRGDLARALDIYAKTARLYPNSLAALTGQAAVLGDLGRTAQMKPLIDKAAAFAPSSPDVVFLQAKLAIAEKDWKRARDLIQPIEGTLPRLAPLRQLYGQAQLRLGLYQQAIAQLQPIVRAMPGNRDAVMLLAEAQLASGDAQGALAVIKPIADSPAARVEELQLAARIAKALGDPAAAGYEARSRAPQPQTLGGDLIDGNAAMRAGNWAGAVAAYQRMLKTAGNRNVIVLNNLAYAQLMLGNADQAIEYADEALKLAPDNPSVLDTAGWARFKTGRDKAAGLKLLERAARLAPANATIGAHLAEARRAPE